MTTKTELHPVLQQLRDALPERMQKQIREDRCHGERLDIPLVGWAGLNYYGDPEPCSVFLTFTGNCMRERTRTYQVKDGKVRTKRFVEVVTELFDKWDEWHRDYDRRVRESEEHTLKVKARYAEVFPQVESPAPFVVDEVESYTNGFRVFNGSRAGDVWVDPDGKLSGTIPVNDLTVEQFNKILRLLAEQ